MIKFIASEKNYIRIRVQVLNILSQAKDIEDLFDAEKDINAKVALFRDVTDLFSGVVAASRNLVTYYKDRAKNDKDLLEELDLINAEAKRVRAKFVAGIRA